MPAFCPRELWVSKYSVMKLVHNVFYKACFLFATLEVLIEGTSWMVHKGTGFVLDLVCLSSQKRGHGGHGRSGGD